MHLAQRERSHESRARWNSIAGWEWLVTSRSLRLCYRHSKDDNMLGSPESPAHKTTGGHMWTVPISRKGHVP